MEGGYSHSPQSQVGEGCLGPLIVPRAPPRLSAEPWGAQGRGFILLPSAQIPAPLPQGYPSLSLSDHLCPRCHPSGSLQVPPGASLGCRSAATPAFPSPVASACPAPFPVPGGFTSALFSPDLSSVAPFPWSSPARPGVSLGWAVLPGILPVCFGNSPAPGAHPAPRGPAGTRGGRAGTRCSSSGRVCVLRLGTASQKCAGRCQSSLLLLLVPRIRFPDKDAFLGATGRILRGTSFVLLDPPVRPGLGGWQWGQELGG